MTAAQRSFWTSVRDLARSVRRGRAVELQAAADALELERMAEARLAADELVPQRLAAARRDPAVQDVADLGDVRVT